MSKVEIQLCRTILREHFGDIVEVVGNILLSRGRSNLTTIVRQSNESVRNVRESLFILMQHGIVTYAEQPEGGRIATYYEVSIERLLLRDRIPFCAATAISLFGDLGGKVVTSIADHGRLTASQIVDIIKQEHESNQDGDGSKLNISTTKATIHEMLEKRYLRVVPVSDSLTVTDQRLNEEKEAIEARGAPLTAGELKKLRSSLEAERMQRQLQERGGSITPPEKKRKMVMDFDDVVHNKRQKIMDAGDSEIPFDDIASHTLAINYERFALYQRNIDISNLAQQRVNETAKEIVSSILDMTFHSVHEAHAPRSESVTVGALGMALNKLKAEVYESVTNPIRDYLDTLHNDPYKIVTKIDERGGGEYVVSFQDVVYSLKVNLLESVIQERFGGLGARLFRLLLEKQKLDDKQASKLALINHKVGREILYEMFTAGFVFIQDVPKTLDHSASRTFFLWYVSVEKTCNILLRNAYMTMNRLKIRRLKEFHDRSLLLEKTQRSDVLSGEASLSESDQKNLQRLDAISLQLLASQFEIDHMIMLLRDY